MRTTLEEHDNIRMSTEVDSLNLVTIEELAQILKVPKGWIYQRTCCGQSEIPFVKCGKYLRFDPKEVIDFFHQKTVEKGGQ